MGPTWIANHIHNGAAVCRPEMGNRRQNLQIWRGLLISFTASDSPDGRAVTCSDFWFRLLWSCCRCSSIQHREMQALYMVVWRSFVYCLALPCYTLLFSSCRSLKDVDNERAPATSLWPSEAGPSYNGYVPHVKTKNV